MVLVRIPAGVDVCIGMFMSALSPMIWKHEIYHVEFTAHDDMILCPKVRGV